jgi:hypothetical protein
MSTFLPGQRVLCIDGRFHPSVWEYVNAVPLEGEIYTVERIRPRARDNVTGQFGPGLMLKEIPGSLPGSSKVISWCIWRFAPLDIRQTETVTQKKGTCPTKKKAATKPRRLEPVPG